MLSKVQRGLERLYRLTPKPEVGQFVIDTKERDEAGVARSPREQLLLQEDEDGLAIGLYLDPDLLGVIAGRGAGQLVRGQGFGDFMMLVEGVSHFVYVAFKAEKNHQLSALELELQAEVDKYVTCLLSTEQSQTVSAALRKRLFKDIVYDTDLDQDEQERYRVANNNALRYSESLEKRFVARQSISEMLVELRRFYRMSLTSKLRHIRDAA
jgi:hypothetical protein